MNRSIIGPRVCCLFLFLVGQLWPAFGKDVNALINLLYSAFLAEQGAAMCMAPSINIPADDRAVFLDTHQYAQAIRQKVSTGLGDSDVQFIVKSAADHAREQMLQVVNVFKSNPPDKEYAELFRWCTNIMKPAAENMHRDLTWLF